MQFSYTARSLKGQMATGVISVESAAHAQQQLREQGLFVVALESLESARTKRGAGRRSRVGPRELLAMTSQLSIMARAGMDLASALQSLARQCSHPQLKLTLEAVYEDVMAGKSVSVAMRQHIHVFGNAYVASIAAGESAGQLPQVLGRLATMQRNELRLRGSIRSLLAYPIVLSLVSLIVIAGVMFFVLPQFSEVFGQFEMALPWITQLLLDVSHELRKRFLLWGLLFAGVVIGVTRWAKSPAGRRTRDRLLLEGAVIRNVTQSLMIGRVFRLLSIMVQSGVPLLEALRLTRSSIQNTLYRELFDTMESDVLNGRGLAGSLVASRFVPPAAGEMIMTAERTGTLGMVTEVMADYYEEDGESRMRELATMLEPLIIIVMGVFVAAVVLAVMLPMFDFATFAEGK